MSTIPPQPSAHVAIVTKDGKQTPLLLDWFTHFSAYVKGITQNFVASTRAINTTAPLTGGGNLSADLTLSITGLSVTITTAKLTGGGANGSMTFTDGVLTSQTPAT